MSEYGLRAAELYSEGYNCAQAVAGAFAEKLGVTLEFMTKAASAFGGGYAGTRNTCGAVSGMLLVYGIARGHTLAPKEEKQAHYKASRLLVEEFSEKAGTSLCRELLAAQGCGGISCKDVCALAADIVAEKI